MGKITTFALLALLAACGSPSMQEAGMEACMAEMSEEASRHLKDKEAFCECSTADLTDDMSEGEIAKSMGDNAGSCFFQANR